MLTPGKSWALCPSNLHVQSPSCACLPLTFRPEGPPPACRAASSTASPPSRPAPPPPPPPPPLGRRRRRRRRCGR
eukprot:6202009-Pleurochrysis_carterae.AAC.1